MRLPSFTWKTQGYFTAVYAVFREPSFPKGLNGGRDDRALALASPPAALPGLSPACGLARDGPTSSAQAIRCGESPHAASHRWVASAGGCRVRHSISA